MPIRSPIFTNMLTPFVVYWSPHAGKAWPRDERYKCHIRDHNDIGIAICGYKPPDTWYPQTMSACVHPVRITCPKCMAKAKALFDNIKFRILCLSEPVDGSEVTTHDMSTAHAVGLAELNSEIERMLMRGINSFTVTMVPNPETKDASKTKAKH